MTSGRQDAPAAGWHPAIGVMVDRIRRVRSVERNVLVGSRARGDHDDRSDIDLAVACPAADLNDWAAVWNAVDEAPTLLAVDLVRRDEVDEPLRRRIEAERVTSMSAPDATYALTNFGQALARLEDATALPADDPIQRDSVILRFVLVHETAWKALCHCLAIEQIQARHPKEAFRQAFQVGWLENEAIWLKMLEDRDLVAHTYNEATAVRIRNDT